MFIHRQKASGALPAYLRGFFFFLKVQVFHDKFSIGIFFSGFCVIPVLTAMQHFFNV